MEQAARMRGLKEVQRSIKLVSKELPKALRVGLNRVVELVAVDVRAAVEHKSGRAAASVRAKSTQTAARIAVGGPSAPYYPWLDFGGRVGKNKSVHRPVVKSGRYVYPAVARHRDEFLAAAGDVVADVARQAGIQVSTEITR